MRSQGSPEDFSRVIVPALVVGAVLVGCWLLVKGRNPVSGSGANEPKLKLRAVRMIDLGEFEVVSGRVAITDPGYGKSYLGPDGISKLARNVLKGLWKAYSIVHVIGSNDTAVCAELVAYPAARPLPESPKWQAYSGCIGVDTGQAGFFDFQYVDSPEVVPKDYPWKDGKADPDNPWYSYCCEVTGGKHRAGVIPYGVVSSSGYGDGGYQAYLLRDEHGTVVGLRVVFDSLDDYDLTELKPQP